ncbi:hypothetical protein RRF56_11195 [Nodosilinea sp. E11]|nr:hypothetical protein RRF56_11195 [Nodosilinea sp. E11]
MIQSINLDQTIAAWRPMANTIFVPRTNEQYERLVTLLDGLIDQVGEDEEHPLASMMDVVGALIENYETKYVPVLEEVA